MEMRSENLAAGKVFTLRQSQKAFYVTAVVLVAIGILGFLNRKTDGLGSFAAPMIFAGIGVYLWLNAEGFNTVVDVGERLITIERRIGEHAQIRYVAFDDVAALQCSKVWFHNNEGARLPSIAFRLRLQNGELVTMCWASAFSHAEALQAAMQITRAVGVRLEQTANNQRI